ncbi:MAG TPA: PAS domain S-box protein, partial [bacterium]|nr:PAS domain S-box protein [bacterium]
MQKTNSKHSIEQSNQTYKIIVIEDNEALNRLIVKNLNKKGFKARAAFDAQQGLEQISGIEREIILLDYKLPDMDARELIQHMENEGIKTPFIIMTAHGGEKIAVEFMRMGAIDYIVKEKDFTDLLIPKVKRACNEIENKKQLNEARNKLQKSEAKYRSLVEEMDDLVCRFDTDGKPIFANESYRRYFGIDEPLEMDDFMPLIPEEDQSKAEKYFKQLSKNQDASSIEHRVIARNNELRWVHWRTRPIIGENNELIAFQGIGRDITKRKRAERALKESEEKYRRLIEASPGITYIYGTESGGNFWSSRVENILGISPDRLKNDPQIWSKSIHPEDKGLVKKTIANCQKNDKFDIEYRIKDVDGNWHWLHDRCISVREENGEKIIEGLATDITVRKKAEEALRESENKFRSLVEQAAEMLFLHDTKGNIVDINNTAVDKTGYSRKELLNMNVLDIDVDKDEKEAKQKYWDKLAPHDKPTTFETHHKTKDGSIYPVEITISKVVLSKGNYILALGRDITERKAAEQEKEKLQKQLLQSQKLESIGTLASGVAHDFNNILTVIIGLSQMTLNNTEKSSSNHNNLKNILDAAQRAADLT